MTVPTCPDCARGACRVCCGIALDEATEQVTECECPACHDGMTTDCHEAMHERCKRRGSPCSCGCHFDARLDGWAQ